MIVPDYDRDSVISVRRRDQREFCGIFCRNDESCNAFVKCGFDDDRIFEGKHDGK